MTSKERAVELFQRCTCSGIDIGVGVMHEPTCGLPTMEDVAHAIREAEQEAFERGAWTALEAASHEFGVGACIEDGTDVGVALRAMADDSVFLRGLTDQPKANLD